MTFYGCGKLARVSIPESVVDIGGYAFDNCPNITDVTISRYVCENESLAVLFPKSTAGLTNIKFPENLTAMGDSLFANCTGLSTVVIPDCVTNMGRSVFMGCSGLENVKLPDRNQRYKGSDVLRMQPT